MNIRKYFPFSESVSSNDSHSLVVSLLIYAAALVVTRIVSWLFGWLILIGPIVSIAAALIGIYCTLGLLMSLFIYFEVI